MKSTAEQIKNVAGHKAKCTVILGLGLKCDQHDETKGYLPVELANKYSFFRNSLLYGNWY